MTTAVPRATFALALLAALPVREASAKHLTVGACAGATPFATIQAAVAAAGAGDTVLVCPGTYPEQVEITRPAPRAVE
jgi:pectin methylesterase-like acyl-CoA thioesterase